jgi:polyvinyl alcohol dehydrogenase (cytochrome)
MTRQDILRTLQTGVMKPEGSRLSPAQQIAVAEYLGNGQTTVAQSFDGACRGDPDPPPAETRWDGWGVDGSNTRFQTPAAAGITSAQVPSLRLKWAFGFPGAWATYGQPTAFGGKIFEGSENGTVYALDALTGCIYWTFKAADTVKTAVSIDPEGKRAFFGDTGADVYSVDVFTGKLLWKKHVDQHPAARITGSPLFVDHRLYVPVSSGEEGAAVDPTYPCCTFRGSLVAMDSRTGKTIWKSFTIPGPARRTGQKNSAGTDMWGPSGAAIWSPPTADLKRHAIYVATGNGYSDPPSPYSDAIIAFDLRNGKMLWSRQLNPTDTWNSSCFSPDKANCPQPPGDDFDFGSPPILKSLPGGRSLLIAAQKSGMVYAIDPDHGGALVWQRRIAHGGPLGGIQWGGAADDSLVFYPRSDWEDSKPAAGGGLFALRIPTGEIAWSQAPPSPACLKQDGCSAAQMAPVTAIPQVVFAGSLDGHLRAYDAQSGKVIWDFDTAQPFKTVNGAEARGGSLVATGPLVVGGMLYINSGYTNAMAGNVLLAFSVPGNP